MVNHLFNIQLHILLIKNSHLKKKLSYKRIRKPWKSINDNPKTLRTQYPQQNSQIQDLYSFFQVPPQQDEPINLENSMKNFIQAQTIAYNRLEAQMSYLINIVNARNVELSLLNF